MLREALRAANGLIIVTGPTGSGKTTTLAACLGVLNEPQRKLSAIEDPVEYQIGAQTKYASRKQFAEQRTTFLPPAVVSLARGGV
jgi:type IV pilus assembly protein PilB